MARVKTGMNKGDWQRWLDGLPEEYANLARELRNLHGVNREGTRRMVEEQQAADARRRSRAAGKGEGE